MTGQQGVGVQFNKAINWELEVMAWHSLVTPFLSGADLSSKRYILLLAGGSIATIEKHLSAFDNAQHPEREKERLHKSVTQWRERDFCVGRRVLISGFNQQITRRHSPMTHNCPVGAEIFGGEIETIDRKPKGFVCWWHAAKGAHVEQRLRRGGTFTFMHVCMEEKAARTSEMAQKPN